MLGDNSNFLFSVQSEARSIKSYPVGKNGTLSSTVLEVLVS